MHCQARYHARRLVATVFVAGACVVVPIGDEPNAVAAPNIAGTGVFLDPGHNGQYDASMTRQVPNGRGGTKECNTSGTATDDGYPEHAFNWDVALRIRDALNQMGVHTAMSRDNDNSLGPCVDQRAALA